MYIAWTGLGFLVIPVVFVGGVAVTVIAEFEPTARWPRMIPVLGTVLLVWKLGIGLNRREIVRQDQFGNAITHRESHSLYWIPIQYWVPILLVIGTIAVFKR